MSTESASSRGRLLPSLLGILLLLMGLAMLAGGIKLVQAAGGDRIDRLYPSEELALLGSRNAQPERWTLHAEQADGIGVGSPVLYLGLEAGKVKALKAEERGVAITLEIDAVYAGYLDRQASEAEALRREEGLSLPEGLDYAAIGSLSNEVREKLTLVQPRTLGQAGRISGITPADISLLAVWLEKASR